MREPQVRALDDVRQRSIALTASPRRMAISAMTHARVGTRLLGGAGVQLASEREGVVFALQREEETCSRQQHVVVAARVERPLDGGDGIGRPALSRRALRPAPGTCSRARVGCRKCASLVIDSSRIFAASVVSSPGTAPGRRGPDAASDGPPARWRHTLVGNAGRVGRGQCSGGRERHVGRDEAGVGHQRLLGLAHRARDVPGVE